MVVKPGQPHHVPSDVVPEADIGSLSLQGLSAFSPLLAALSADDVAPVALIQLSKLGSMFRTSGSYVERVPDLLRRQNSTHLERMNLTIGWREGDSMSHMTEIAGGPSSALICFCLSNIIDDTKEMGSVLRDLCDEILPEVDIKASIYQFAYAAQLIGHKLGPLGFGQILSEQTQRLMSVYDSLGEDPPQILLDRLSPESFTELMTAIFKAFDQENCKVRIRGTSCMCLITAVVMTLFPNNTSLMVENQVITEGTKNFITVEVLRRCSFVGIWEECDCEDDQVEVTKQGLGRAIIALEDQSFRYQYRWESHVKESLVLAFASFGLHCPAELLTACCNEVLRQFNKVCEGDCETDHLLGPDHWHVIHQTCQTLFGVVPSAQGDETNRAFDDLNACFEKLPNRMHAHARCLILDAFATTNGKQWE